MKKIFILLVGLLFVDFVFAKAPHKNIAAHIYENSKGLPFIELPSEGLVAYYPFSGDANDISGNDNNPSFVNASLTTDRFGNPNSAYSFDGTTQYIKGSCAYFPTGSRTISLWFKVNDLSKRSGLFGYGGGSCGASMWAAINLCTHPGAFTTQGHCEIHNCSTTNSYPVANSWNNWIITSGNNQTKFYLNGILIETFNNVDYNGTNVSGRDFGFGAIPGEYVPYTDACINYLDGALDDIVIYSTVLSDAQVFDLYNFFSTAPGVQHIYYRDANGFIATVMAGFLRWLSLVVCTG